MWRWVKELDRILRGEATRLPALRSGTIEVPVVGLSAVLVALGLFYGICMGCFGAFRVHPSGLQVLATTLKVPALFLLTLVVTFPSLYVFNALVGSRLKVLPVLRLLVAAMAVNLAVLASIGTIVAFFSVCTTSYPFMVLLNVLVFAVAGGLGLKFLLQTLHRLSVVEGLPPDWPAVPAPPPPPAPPQGAPEATPAATPPPTPDPMVEGSKVLVLEPVSALDRLDGRVLGPHVKAVFRTWVLVFGLVGAQMAWVLRPFIGNPDQRFTWLRARESNFFEAVWHAVVKLFS